MRGNIRNSLIGAVCAGVMMVALLPGSADAKKPLDTDCEALANALIALDAALPPGSFKSQGELVSAVKKDPMVFDMLRFGLAMAGGPLFEDPREVTPTIAKCGFNAEAVALVKD